MAERRQGREAEFGKHTAGGWCGSSRPGPVRKQPVRATLGEGLVLCDIGTARVGAQRHCPYPTRPKTWAGPSRTGRQGTPFAVRLLSRPSGLRPYTDTLLDRLGPNRLMFGSDWPVCLLAADYGEVVAVADKLIDPLSPQEPGAVFGETAAEWYRIPLYDWLRPSVR
ncbi:MULTISPECIES: amidohydrolase family protein [Streptomyces]|nr:amidohydrolase family protein [Streptomyces canarius]